MFKPLAFTRLFDGCRCTALSHARARPHGFFIRKDPAEEKNRSTDS